MGNFYPLIFYPHLGIPDHIPAQFYIGGGRRVGVVKSQALLWLGENMARFVTLCY